MHSGRQWQWFPAGFVAVASALIALVALALVGSHRQQHVEAPIEAAQQTIDAPHVGERAGWPPSCRLPSPPSAISPPVTAHVNAGDWVLVASFDNQSGEAVLDGTIEAALKRELEAQSQRTR